jgi:hypothetical protein
MALHPGLEQDPDIVFVSVIVSHDAPSRSTAPERGPSVQRLQPLPAGFRWVVSARRIGGDRRQRSHGEHALTDRCSSASRCAANRGTSQGCAAFSRCVHS